MYDIEGGTYQKLSAMVDVLHRARIRALTYNSLILLSVALPRQRFLAVRRSDIWVTCLLRCRTPSTFIWVTCLLRCRTLSTFLWVTCLLRCRTLSTFIWVTCLLRCRTLSTFLWVTCLLRCRTLSTFIWVTCLLRCRTLSHFIWSLASFAVGPYLLSSASLASFAVSERLSEVAKASDGGCDTGASSSCAHSAIQHGRDPHESEDTACTRQRRHRNSFP